MKLNKKGFTLIELLVVIAIIGLLSTVAVVALNTARAKSRDAKRVADIQGIRTALEMYLDACNQYPPTLTTAASTGCTSPTNLGSFISTIPTAPTPNESGCTVAQNTYTYTMVTTSTYTLSYCLGANTGSLAAGAHTATQAGM